jgi:hypothetical protein
LLDLNIKYLIYFIEGGILNELYKRRRNMFLKRKIIKKPCMYEGCDKILYTRAPSKKYCRKHARKFGVRKIESNLYTKNIFNISIKNRVCLKCGRQFTSYGIQNRLCQSCNYENNVMSSRHRHKVTCCVPVNNNRYF